MPGELTILLSDTTYNFTLLLQNVCESICSSSPVNLAANAFIVPPLYSNKKVSLQLARCL